MKPLLPNFLIVGAAKSGTTSLYNYLRSHPDVFMPENKEPAFFELARRTKIPAADPRRSWLLSRTVTTFEDYARLFSEAREGQAIGEATATYLYNHEYAIPGIKQCIPDAKIVICLRNPVERAFSAYTQLLREREEHLSFEQCLELEAERREQHWTMMYAYVDAGFYSRQVRAYLDNFDNVKVYLYEDLRSNAPGILRDLYDFLEIDNKHVVDTRVRHNVSGVPRSRYLYNFLVNRNPLKTALKPIVNRVLPQNIKKRLVFGLTASLLAKPELSSDTRERLKQRFASDIVQLQDIIRRDLSSWLR